MHKTLDMERQQLSQDIGAELLLLRQERRQVERVTDVLKTELRAICSLIGALRKAKRVIEHLKTEPKRAE